MQQVLVCRTLGQKRGNTSSPCQDQKRLQLDSRLQNASEHVARHGAQHELPHMRSRGFNLPASGDDSSEDVMEYLQLG